jgi:hypothetical protein
LACAIVIREPPMLDEEKAYVVRRSGERGGHVVMAQSIEAAAVAWLEITDAVDDEQRIVVRPADGHDEHCLILDADTGEARPC